LISDDLEIISLIQDRHQLIKQWYIEPYLIIHLMKYRKGSGRSKNRQKTLNKKPETMKNSKEKLKKNMP
jgi:hypothetical protein